MAYVIIPKPTGGEWTDIPKPNNQTSSSTQSVQLKGILGLTKQVTTVVTVEGSWTGVAKPTGSGWATIAKPT